MRTRYFINLDPKVIKAINDSGLTSERFISNALAVYINILRETSAANRSKTISFENTDGETQKTIVLP